MARLPRTVSLRRPPKSITSILANLFDYLFLLLSSLPYTYLFEPARVACTYADCTVSVWLHLDKQPGRIDRPLAFNWVMATICFDYVPELDCV